MIYGVYILDAPYHVDRMFDYLSDLHIECGSFVRVPFGRANNLRMGVVCSHISEASEEKNIKPVHSVLSDRPPLSEEMLGLCLFLKEHTLCTFGDAVKTVLAPGTLRETLNIKTRKICSLAVSREEAERLLSEKGALRSEGQKNVIRYLIDIKVADASLIKELIGVSSANISALKDKKIIEITEEEEIRNPYTELSGERDTSPIVLSEAQQRAYSQIESLYLENAPRAALLFGVTGSGKTKVIMKAIDKVIADKKSVIMMVPEIALTPQTVGIFCKRYGDRVAVIHSSLSQGERLDAYRRIQRGDADLIIGTRSAGFAPVKNLGMIVIDEEHEHTYKSESNPKYHARDVAAYRAGKNNALMLLASATPSLESYRKAEEGKYTLIKLTERYGGAKLPEAVIVDMREELRLGNTSPISERLLNSLNGVWEREEQAILFLNRRGYNSQISCKSCGEVISCPRCSVSLTYHTGADGGKLLCHLCGYTERVPKHCPGCSGEELSFLGFGTQKVEGALFEYAPDMKVLRMDADTTGGKLAYDRMIDDFRRTSYDILLGTQMVAKGHDFPKVTLVGVLLADSSLYVSDFRASERTFSLLTQVIGRAGRASVGGTAVIQTYSPTSEIIRLACTQDYEKFYEGEIAIRRELCYPPFCDMVQLTVTGEEEREVLMGAKTLSEKIIEKLSGQFSGLAATVFGPFEAQVYKLNQKYRMRMVVKCRLSKRARELFHSLLCDFAQNRKVTLAVDLNPLSI